VTALLAFASGERLAPVTTAGVAATLIGLARPLLREALRPHQWVGVALILCEVVLVNA
jgi:uncharacterized membrane protein